MSANVKSPHALEPERYELAAPPAYRFEVDRRGFFKFLGAGILVVCVLKDAAVAQESGGRSRGEALPTEIGAWMHIGEDGRVQQARVLRSVQLLDEAALTAVRQWVFTPTRLNGEPVPVVMTVTVTFRLQ